MSINMDKSFRWIVLITAAALSIQMMCAAEEACPSTRAPTVNLTSPEDMSTVSVNEFQIEGTIDTESTLVAAALIVTSENGTVRSYDLLGNKIAEANGGIFATWVRDLLFLGSNNVTVTASDCRGQGFATRTVVFHGTSVVAERTAVSLSQGAENTTSSTRNASSSAQDVPFVSVPLAIAAILGALALKFSRRPR